MDFLGLLRSYKVRRPLTDQERAVRLDQKIRLNVIPHYQLSVIQLNSTFLEVVDKWFPWRGVISLIGFAIIVIGGLTLGGGAIYWLLGAAGVVSTPLDSTLLFWNGIGMGVVASAVGWCGFWLLRKDAFSYTHYPICFNSKTQMVHVFRTDGTVLSVPWSQILFSLGNLVPGNNWEVRGHLLDDDLLTVVETFALSHVDMLSPDEIFRSPDHVSSTDFLRAHWEFIRRYMEEGPEELISQVKFCMPVDSMRESISVSFQRTFANFSTGPVLLYWMMFPILLILAVFRVLSIRTSKIPGWPQHVKETCKIEPGDPYAIRGDRNGDRIFLYPEEASATGLVRK